MDREAKKMLDPRYLGWISVFGVRPISVTKKQCAIAYGKGGVSLVKRLIYATKRGMLRSDGKPWLEFEEEGHRKKEKKIFTDSAELAYAYYKAGDKLPFLPSQLEKEKIF